MKARLRQAVLVAILAGTLGFAIVDYRAEDSPARAPEPSGPGVRSADAKPAGLSQAPAAGELPSAALPERAPLGDSGAELFASSSWQPPPPPVPTVAAKPPAPVAPPVPYRFAGQLIRGDRPEIFLAKGEVVIPVGKGDTLDGLYRVEAIGETQITLIYLPLKQAQTIPVFGVLAVNDAGGPSLPAAPVPQAGVPRASAAPPAAPAPTVTAPVVAARPPPVLIPSAAPTKPARLLWEGPQHVKLGAPFSVTLKVTSEQSVRATPMQVRFDPAFLEFVAARAGKYFGAEDRNFTYRVNPDGSIFVGAANQNPTPATDAELLVLTFRPLKPSPVAELSVASLNLQGPAGHVIAFDPLVAFKTAITQ